ncbi:MAG: amidase, partial [Gammaproteobacteria bacterium]|nr:amidase [Gammaproteobacteria bacterium]
EYLDLLAHRARLKALFNEKMRGLDFLVSPTVAIKPPTLAAMEDPAESGRINLLCLRNTAVSNFLDRPAISIPCHDAGEAPVGFMLMGQPLADRELLAMAARLESVIRGSA